MNNVLYLLCFSGITLLSVVFVALIKAKVLPLKLSYPCLFLVAIFSVILTIASGPTLSELGIIRPTFFDGSVYSVVTIVCCVVMLLLNKHRYKQVPIDDLFTKDQAKISFYVLLSAPIQEFLFRSFLFYSLGLMGILNIMSMTILSSLVFGIAHLGHDDEYLIQGTFLVGIIWGVAYFLIPNLLLISISHAIIGLFAFSQGLIKKKSFFMGVV